MAIYAISDLHLSFKNPKPMNIFGDNWQNHEEKIKTDWESKVNNEDIVILPGDFSWAMSLEEAYLDFKYLNSLPGEKYLLKGNHDYWWTTLKKMQQFLEDNNFFTIHFINNNSFLCENCIIAGTRGWQLNEQENDEKIFKRELARLELSIQSGIKNYGEEKEIFIFMHYPPITKTAISNNSELKFVDIMKKYNVKRCLYGHLHSYAHSYAVEGEFSGIQFNLISADYLNFKLLRIK